jgi:hypothetical protein
MTGIAKVEHNALATDVTRALFPVGNKSVAIALKIAALEFADVIVAGVVGRIGGGLV